MADLPAKLQPVLEGCSFDRTTGVSECCDATGVMLSVQPPKRGTQSRMGYDAAKQVWVPCRADGEITHYIGWWKDNPPRPEDLERHKMLDGNIVTLKGKQFVIPVLHVPTFGMAHRVTIPSKIEFTEYGWAPSFDERYASLVERSARWFDAVHDPKNHPFKYGEELDFVTDILNTNYMVGPWEVSALNMLDSAEVCLVIWAALGFTALDEENALKKALASTRVNG